MSFIAPPPNDCPTAYGGCPCMCHRMPGVMHCIPCCYPTEDELDSMDEMISTKEDLNND